MHTTMQQVSSRMKNTHFIFGIIVVYYYICNTVEQISAFDSHLRGPAFVMEPPSKLEFSNSSGGWLDCSATGSPQPTIDWLSVDGTSVGDVGGVRRVHRNGTLVLLPFPAAAYRQDIHSTIYRCVASNSVGRVISRDVQVRAVVAQAYKVEVEILAASRGCTAILRCVVPNFVKELVRVVSWVQDPAFYIYPSLQGDGKFHLLPTGELLIHNLEYNDRFASYKCRTMHRLTRQVVVSAATKVRINDHRALMSPSIVEHTSHVSVSQDEGAVLLCLAQGCPAPEYHWYQYSGSEAIPVLTGPRMRLLGPVLAIEAVTTQDSGVYKCTSANAGGEASADLRLTVSAPLHVEIIPNVLSVNMGGSADFRCVVTSNGSPVTMQHITWFKDGRQLPSSGRIGDTLMVTSVSREDKGMYQCVVRRQEGDTFQASAELQLGDAPPTLIYSFIEQTLQPGPAVSLKCSATGNPTPHIKWTLDGFELPQNGRFMKGQYVTIHGDVISHVNISHVMVEDAGEYKCTAENRAGKVSHSARLNVYGLPYIRLIPPVTAVAGEALHLKCPVAGYPIEEIHWERNGRELPDDIRQKVHPDGMLVIDPVQKTTDSGQYTCWARNKQGHSARRSGEVTVIVPPTIEPFSFQDGLAEGMRTRTVCGVSRGDPPITLRWLKDGDPLSSMLGANVSSLDHYSSLLSISSLSAIHTGDYTCVASNPAAEVKYTATLKVKVPPRWMVEPMDVSVERKGHITLHCQAQGVPIPTVVWKKATGSKSGDYEVIKERTYTKLLSNGSLYLQHVKEDREGFYLCQANNGIGTGIGKVIQLKVNSAPYFNAPQRQITVKKGDTAILQCEVNGDKPINVIWLRGGKHELNPSTNYRVSIKQDATPEGIAAEAQIANVDSSDSGSYFCQAQNLYGRDQQLVHLIVQEPPQAPSALEASMITSRSVSLKWQPRGVDAAEVTKYIVEYREIDRQWHTIELADPPKYNVNIEDLKPATRYAFRVVAEGSAGRSVPSQELTIRTEMQRPAGPPLNINARPISSTEIQVSWLPPLAELRHGDIQGYNVGFKAITTGQTNYNFTSTAGDGEDGTGEMILTGLLKYTRYTIVAQAFNQIGPGPLSEPVTAQTMEDVPSKPPEEIRCTSLSSTSLQISWQPPPPKDTNGLLQGYKVSFETMADETAFENDEMETRTTNTLTYMLNNLKKYTNYSVQVLANTRMGDGVLSDPIYCQTEEDAPEAPADIKVVVSSPQSLHVSWQPPKEQNGVISKYNLYMRATNGREELNHEKKTLPSQQLFYEAKNLQTMREYQFWVSASTRIGEGKSSRVVSQMTSSRVAARIVSFGGLLVIPWKQTANLQCTAVGQPKLEWYKKDSILRTGSGHNVQILDTGELIITNLQQQDTGNYTCQVDNGIGTDRLTYNLLVQVPPATPVLYVTSATSNSILMHWKNGFTGNAPITGYTIHYRRTHGNMEELQLSRHATSHELKDLACGSMYQIYLTVSNRIGTSPGSTTLHVRTQGQAPGMPQPPALIAPNSTSVLLRLNSWPDQGCPILYFNIQYRLLSEATTNQWNQIAKSLKPQKRYTIVGLQPATLYQLKVDAMNVAGLTTGDFTFVTLTKDGDPPPPEIVQRGKRPPIFYFDLKFLIIIVASSVGFIILIVIVMLCFKYRKSKKSRKEIMENQQNADAQRDRYYATIHKGIPGLAGDKIPETSEDISPYATFQLSEASTLAQHGPANTLLHSFMYHERAMTEGCASPPPAVLRTKPHNIKSPYYNIAKSRRRHSRKTDPESEESDSDADQLTSSRTESSNQLDAKLKHSMSERENVVNLYQINIDKKFPGLIYHGTQSSTSSDLSPMSEQKSLPRRGRQRGTMRLLPLQLTAEDTAITNFDVTPDGRIELSEAECDIDTLKKLKLGMRSSLWARPANPTPDNSERGGNNGSNGGGGGGNKMSGHPSDYSIAV